MLTRIGIAGGIGSGKSEVCRNFEALGVLVLSADTIARDLSDSDPIIRNKIIARFGAEAYQGASSPLNREYISRRVFADERELSALNAIVHPFVIQTIESRLDSSKARGKFGYVIVEAALMFESGLDKKMDYVLTVVANEPFRIDRVRRRDNIEEADIRARMKHQIPVEEALTKSDFVIHNNDSVERLHERVMFFHAMFSVITPRKRR